MLQQRNQTHTFYSLFFTYSYAYFRWNALNVDFYYFRFVIQSINLLLVKVLDILDYNSKKPKYYQDQNLISIATGLVLLQQHPQRDVIKPIESPFLYLNQ